ncbi:hypothetical protein LCGC14_3163820 [marine sediment metagenome]|uniref:Uncharacterized protein n=1 Tax=marine sediment metagenome TaxID=412755 RepID=A0A0F8VQF7_9ZZZZ
MNKFYLSGLMILLLTLVPSVYMCVKYTSYFEQLEDNGGTIRAYEQFASEVESGALTNEDISYRLSKIAASEKGISQGFGLMKLSFYYWGVTFLVITLLQGLILRGLLKAQNKVLFNEAENA